MEKKSILSNSKNYLMFGLICMALGLSLSKPAISLGVIFLFVAWIIDGNIKQKLKHFFSNKIALILCGIYLISVFGLLYTSNFDYGLDDVRRKMFLFIVPFLMSGLLPITHQQFHTLLKIYIIGVLASTLWSFVIYMGWYPIEIYDARDYSRFNSHIRFGLEIVIAFFFSTYYFYRQGSFKQRSLWSIILVWLLLSLVMFKIFTGSLVLILTIIILITVLGYFSTNKKLKYTLISILPVLIISVFGFVAYHINFYKKLSTVPPIQEIEQSKYGEKYQKDDYTQQSTVKENGYYVERNIAWTELQETWNKRSQLDFSGKDMKGNKIQYTILRFITSKGLRKDRESVGQLTEDEVKAIERGIPNVTFLHMNYLSVRMQRIIWEFDNYFNGKNYNGHSVVMRWVYWKTGFQIVKNNLFIGVGTGDVQDAFNNQYNENHTELQPKYQLRAHNQFITYAVSFGLIGFVLFVLFLFYPMFNNKLYKNYLYLSFFTVICLSMLTEDTLETQVGIGLFVFFNSLFILNKR